MVSGDIRDFQLSGSSRTEVYSYDHGRLLFPGSGWCAESVDVRPYFQVHLFTQNNQIYYVSSIMRTTKVLGPVVQRIVSLSSSLVVKMLIVLVSTISNSKVFLLEKCERLLQMQKLLTFFSKKFNVYAIFND